MGSEGMAKEEANDDDENDDEGVCGKDEDDDENKVDTWRSRFQSSADEGDEVSNVSGRTATKREWAADATIMVANREMAEAATISDDGGGGSRNRGT